MTSKVRKPQIAQATRALNQHEARAPEAGLPTPRAEFRLLIRQRILDAARVCFQGKSFSSTTMEEIAKRARISRTAIYQYFQNKSQIIKEMIDEDWQLFLNSFVIAMPVDFHEYDAVREGVLTMLALYKKERALMQVMNEAAALDPTVSDWLEGNFRNYLAEIVEQTSRDRGDAASPKALLEVRTWICIAAMDSLFQRQFDPRWNLDQEIVVEEVTALWSTLIGGVQAQQNSSTGRAKQKAVRQPRIGNWRAS